MIWPIGNKGILETDPPHPLDVYGQSKYQCEVNMLTIIP